MIFQLITLSYLMFFVANSQPYDAETYNCHHHALLLTEMLQEHGFEAYYRSGYVDWDRYETQEEIDRLDTNSTINIGDYKCCHAWVEIVLFGQNFTIESTTGYIADGSLYVPRDYKEPPK